MKKIIIIIFLAISILNNAQESNKLSPELLTFPVSPEAGRLATYGNVVVNTFYGRLNKTIELFNGNIGDFKFPLNLSYNYAGNRPEESPSIVGLGWQLNVGGVVTREVRGLPDEHPRGYNSLSTKDVLNNYLNNNAITYFDAVRLSDGNIDSEADKYTVSVSGLNFSFKIGVDGTPAFLSKHDNKVKINKNISTGDVESFEVTDNRANRYFFEEKEINEPYYGLSAFFDEDFPKYTSSWQLSKIIVNNGVEIFFNYDNDDYLSYDFYATFQHRSIYVNQLPDSYNEGGTINTIKRKILKSVTSSNFNFNFDYIKQNNQEVYSKITIRDNYGKTVDLYDFEYTEPRNQLIKIKRNNSFFFGFDYYGSVPPFINSVWSYPRNQDEWGFANAANNTSQIYCFGTIHNADKRPDFSSTLNGALKTINYQSGGSTTVVYEQNKIPNYSTGSNEPNVRIHLTFKSDNNPSAPSTKERIFTKTFTRDVEATLTHSISNINFVDLSIKKIAGDLHFQCGQMHNHENTPYYVMIPHIKSINGQQNTPRTDIFLNEVSQVDSNCASFNNCSRNENSSGKFIIPAGTYEFKFKTDFNQYQDVQAEVRLDFFDIDVANKMSNFSGTAVGGIRVLSTIDSPVNSPQIVKNYDYNDDSGVSTGKTFNKLPLNYVVPSKETCCANYNGGGPFWTYFEIPIIPNVLIYSSKSSNLLIFNSSPIFYNSVKEYVTRVEKVQTLNFGCLNCTDTLGNEDGTNSYSYMGGGVYGEKTYFYSEGYKMKKYLHPLLRFTDYPFVPTGTNLSMGLVSENTVFSRHIAKPINKISIKEENLFFDTENEAYRPITLNNSNYPRSLKVAYKVRLVDASIPQPPFTLNDFFFFKEYKEFDVEHFISNTKTTEYFNNQPIEKNTLIEYDSHFNQKKITTSNSVGDVLTTEISYPYDFSDATSLDMVSKNYIAPRVKIVNKKNGEITDSYKYDFSSITSNLFKPISFWQSKGNEALEKKNIFSYDAWGNINLMTQVSKEVANPHGVMSSAGEMYTQIIWGYNFSLPVAKIEYPKESNISIPNDIIDAIHNASNSGSEPALQRALIDLRTHPSLINSLVTTYTHIPLVGVKTITDPKGLQTTYEYDEFNRLKQVKDYKGNVLNQNEYHYKN